ncbi:MAG: TlpA disulfide reductase family protein [Bacteroidota bacterium]
MKFTVFTFCLLLSISVFAQSEEVYSTDGENRITKEEVEEMRVGLAAKFSKNLDRDMYVYVVREKLLPIQDSTIFKIKFDITDKRREEAFSDSPFLKFYGKPFPDYTFKTLDGEDFELSQLMGKPTLVNFWFTGCAPCIDEMPALNNIKEEYGEDVQFIAITFDDKKKVNKFLDKRPFTFLHLVNAKKFLKKMDIKSFPQNFLLNSEGIIIEAMDGIPYTKDENAEMVIGDGNELIQAIEEVKGDK